MEYAARMTVAIALLLISSRVHAQAPEDLDIPCSEAPETAIVSMPPRLQDVAQVICTPYGHLITSADGQYWTYPGALAPVMLLAYLDVDEAAPVIVNHARHFTRIEARDIAAADMARHLGAQDGLSPPPPDATIVGLEIVAVNQDNVEQRIILLNDGRSRWGYLCEPACKPKESFLALDFRKPQTPAVLPKR